MILSIPKEIVPGERRVAATPDSVRRLLKKGFEIQVESDAGLAATFTNRDYELAGAKMISDPESLFSNTDVILKVQGPAFNAALEKDECDLMREGTVLIGLLQPLTALATMKRLAQKKITAFAMELMPRITRAQRMDVLSAMSSLAGYKAVLLAAAAFGRIFPMMSTAAGTLYPAKVLVLGAGVAGLQAIATAKRLGAVVEAFDVRRAAKEEVESLGATFVSLELTPEEGEGTGGYAKALSEASHQKELALIHAHVKAADIVITTALIPGKKAPVLITAEALKAMKRGSVIVDMAAETGGNCSETRVGQTVSVEGVMLIGAVNLAASIPVDASQMYANNLTHFLNHLCPELTLMVNPKDEITQGTLVTHEGVIVHERVKAAVEASESTKGRA